VDSAREPADHGDPARGQLRAQFFGYTLAVLRRASGADERDRQRILLHQHATDIQEFRRLRDDSERRGKLVIVSAHPSHASRTSADRLTSNTLAHFDPAPAALFLAMAKVVSVYRTADERQEHDGRERRMSRPQLSSRSPASLHPASPPPARG